MKTNEYSIRWLTAADSAQVAELEARVHPREHQAGNELIAQQLEAMDEEGRNLSLGLYCRSGDSHSSSGSLVGFGLAFVMRDRIEMGEFFDAPVPAQLPTGQPTLYIADWVVEPQHRRASRLMSEKFITTVRARDELRDLPVDAFSTPEYTAKWSAHEKFVGRAGWRLVDRYPFHDAKLNRPMYWLHFARLAEDLSAFDERISERIRALSVNAKDLYHSEHYLRAWYSHLGLMQEPSPKITAHPITPSALSTLESSASRRDNNAVSLLEQRMGAVRFELESASAPELLERYLQLEQLAPEDELGQGATQSGQHIGFYRALASRSADALGMQVGLLFAGEHLVAGLLGFLWQRCFYLVHITRPEPFAALDPDHLALKMLMGRCVQQRACDSIDLSQLDRASLRNWAPGSRGPSWLSRIASKILGTSP